jgi:mono/diheme cytochrome c family protein
MSKAALLLLLALAARAQDKPLGLGRPATPPEIAEAAMTVFPDGRGLPPGSGTAARGRAVYRSQCAECHNDNGEGRDAQYPPLKGGIGSLATRSPRKTVGSYWPYATTVFDYIRRSMPFDHPRSLTADEVYSVTAFVLFLNGIVSETAEINAQSLPAVRMPNRDGFLRHDESPVTRARRRPPTRK